MDRPRRAVITGGTTGIGLAIAQALGRDGYQVVLNYRTDERAAVDGLRHLSEEGIVAEAIRADVQDETAVHELVGSAISKGPIDVWVNNVGAFLFKPFADTSLAEWQSILDSNLTSAFLCSREILPHMRSQGHGALIQIASMHAEVARATPNTLPYAIAKSGVILLTKSLARTEAAYGIRVNAVCPGFVEGGEYTPPEIGSKIPLGRAALPEEIAAAVAFLASDRAAYVTGAALNVHGGAFL